MNENSLKIAFHKLLIPELFGKINNQTAILEENEPDAKLKIVNIDEVPNDSILIKIDYGQAYNNIFRNQKGELKRCDYILVANLNENKKVLLFIEMKSQYIDGNELIQKFHASECLFDYIVSTLKHFHDQNINCDEYKKRFILFQKKRIDKKGTRPSKVGFAPENYLSINFNSAVPPTLKSLS
ncbi:MAG: hypothetical protein LBQ50_13275 [Planctomycetaceae bacterium]|jgi:hypothetical protein|nr:hypothetical protein [Planctomycetaceae bacterium]